MVTKIRQDIIIYAYSHQDGDDLGEILSRSQVLAKTCIFDTYTAISLMGLPGTGGGDIYYYLRVMTIQSYT